MLCIVLKPYSFLTDCIRDVIFMVDESVSMHSVMPVIKYCLAGVIDRLDIGYRKTRVALGTFSHEAHTRWELDRS